MCAYVVAEREVMPYRAEGDTASVRVTIDQRSGSQLLEQRVVRYAAGRSKLRALESQQEILYAVSGHGNAVLNGRPHALEPGTGLYVGPSEAYEVDNPGPADLLIVSVSAPASAARVDLPERRTVRYHDQPSLPASGDREFRYLVTAEVGCLELTQFVGEIAPGRAPEHSHVYDEVIHVLDGEGVLHTDGGDEPVSEGSSIHLPPLLVHSLENTGETTMRVVAVFHPAGDPASRAYEAKQP